MIFTSGRSHHDRSPKQPKLFLSLSLTCCTGVTVANAVQPHRAGGCTFCMPRTASGGLGARKYGKPGSNMPCSNTRSLIVDGTFEPTMEPSSGLSCAIRRNNLSCRQQLPLKPTVVIYSLPYSDIPTTLPPTGLGRRVRPRLQIAVATSSR